MQFLEITSHLCLLQNIGYVPCVVRYILEPVLRPVVGTSHSPTPVLPIRTLLSSNHKFVLYTCESACFSLYSLVCCIF